MRTVADSEMDIDPMMEALLRDIRVVTIGSSNCLRSVSAVDVERRIIFLRIASNVTETRMDGPMNHQVAIITSRNVSLCQWVS